MSKNLRRVGSGSKNTQGSSQKRGGGINPSTQGEGRPSKIRKCCLIDENGGE